jgi:hypothetical protein
MTFENVFCYKSILNVRYFYIVTSLVHIFHNLGSCGLDIYFMMISEIDVMLLNGTLNIVCPVRGGFVNIPLPGKLITGRLNHIPSHNIIQSS